MRKNIFIIALFTLLFSQCSIYKTYVNLSRLQFKLNGVADITLAGVSLSGKTRLSDFSPLEIASISSKVLKGSLPISFTLNVDALNPNDGTGGYQRTDAQLKAFPYRFVIDNKELFSGDIGSPVDVPGTGESVTIPLMIQFDLVQNFKNQGYESLINLALRFAGIGSGTSEINLFAKPVVSTFLGDISYPAEIKIDDKVFTSK